MRTSMEGFSANGHPKLELLEKQLHVPVTHLEAHSVRWDSVVLYSVATLKSPGAKVNTKRIKVNTKKTQNQYQKNQSEYKKNLN